MSKEVMRLNIIPVGQPNPSANGLYVRHDDYASLEQECERLCLDNLSKNGSIKAFGAQIAALQRAVTNRDKLKARAEAERDAALLQVEAALAVFPLRADGQVFNVNGQKITADGDERFYSAKRVDEFLVAVHAALQAKT